MGQHTDTKAMRDLRLILAAMRPRPSDVIDDPDHGLALAPWVSRPLLRRVWVYRRPAALASILRTCERRWERRRAAGRNTAANHRNDGGNDDGRR